MVTKLAEDLFAPKSIAIIGASGREGSVGYSSLDNLLKSGYNGRIYPINPKREEIFGLKTYKSLLDIPEEEEIQCAVVITPARTVPGIIEQCGQKGVGVAVIISAGFKEIGGEGAELEKQISEIANKHKIRILGPNVLGHMNTWERINTSFASQQPIKGKIAFASQSGAFCTSILDWSLQQYVGFSFFVSLGNKVANVGIDEIDMLEMWKNDDNTNVIMMYLEGITNGPKFIEVAKEVSRIKPIIILKSGTTASGSRAVSSHTGSLAGADMAYDAAFKQSGVIRAHGAQELFDFSLAFDKLREKLPKGDRLAIITNAGGPGIMATDEFESRNLRVASFSKETITTLKEKLPHTASVYNPVDVVGDADSTRYKVAVETIIKDSNVDGILVILTPQSMTEIEKTAELIVDASKETNKPIMTCFIGGNDVEPAIKILHESGVPNFAYPERAAVCYKSLLKYSNYLKAVNKGIIRSSTGIVTKPLKKIVKDPSRLVTRPVRSVGRPVAGFFGFDKKSIVFKVFNEVLQDNRVSLTEVEAKRVLRAYHVPVPTEYLVTTEEEAVSFSSKIGFPVAMKIVSPQIHHKTDVGGVRLNIADEKEAQVSYNQIMTSAGQFRPDATLTGVLVSPMVPKGKEIIIGQTRDPQFGPLIMFGLGGIYVELLKDVSFRVSPLTEEDCYSMIDEIQTSKLLKGFRGDKPADIDAIVETLLQVDRLMRDFDEIVEFDINPMVVYDKGKGVLCLDSKMTLKFTEPVKLTREEEELDVDEALDILEQETLKKTESDTTNKEELTNKEEE